MTVVVVGCGIVGAACAYELASRGVDVDVYESGSIGGGSTARSAGGVRSQFSTPVNVELSRASLPVWESFEEEFGVDIGFRQVGYLFLAREEKTAATFRENVAMQREFGVPVEFLAPEELRDRYPNLHAEAFEGGTYADCDGFADPYLALQGYAAAAREEGATIHTHSPVTDVLRDGSDEDAPVSGVVADGEQVDADAVVNAAGPWAGEVAAMAEVDLPVSPRRRQALVVDPTTPVPEDAPLSIDLDVGVYFRPEREGAAIVGGEFGGEDPEQDPDRYDEKTDLEWAATAIERAADVASYFGPETRIRRGWAGLYAVTPDNHPILEETVPGFINAVGYSGHGFQHAPATGTVVAELYVDGEASTIDVSGLASDRFETGLTHVERNVA
ncbi:sarcosine oxidase, subunit beta [Halalkaliarchaeum desulfuricum]|uniref:Sarcosine oxidase, subunit beta n=1 Tax=Halalkaliarchaeum desulfuricum TaxID=2055893 RepID=A0A343TMW7_9EURY|nr:FAD-dependent oxidoreductase [Halalkaliarchaeum desulfuricum]AUX10439.1 sarcosine oxidase, subunit beta [Halalkaliarchaeum desulfuricum]